MRRVSPGRSAAVAAALLLLLPTRECQQQQSGAPPALPAGTGLQTPSGGHPPAGDYTRRVHGSRDWRDPNLNHTLWRSRTPLGNAEVYIVLALLIGLITVVIGCWLSDNCWSPEPEHRRFVSRA